MDILDVKRGLCVHGVNCQGKMAKGLALAVRKKYPKVYTDYIHCYMQGYLKPGYVIFTEITDELCFASACTQLYYGKTPGVSYISDKAISQCFKTIYDFCVLKKHDLFYPAIGAGLGGGNWPDIHKTILSLKPPAITATFCTPY